jgi:hypothetical protein
MTCSNGLPLVAMLSAGNVNDHLMLPAAVSQDGVRAD